MKGRAKAVKSFLQGIHVLHGENSNFLFFTSLLIAASFLEYVSFPANTQFFNLEKCRYVKL